MLNVIEILTDCDQDTLVMKVKIGGDGVACHTGRKSCFYRRVVPDLEAAAGAQLTFTDV